MTTITTHDMSARLPHVLALLAAGEELLVTDHGQAVARMLPPGPPAAASSPPEWQRRHEDWLRFTAATVPPRPEGFRLADDREAIYVEREDAQR